MTPSETIQLVGSLSFLILAFCWFFWLIYY